MQMFVQLSSVIDISKFVRAEIESDPVIIHLAGAEPFPLPLEEAKQFFEAIKRLDDRGHLITQRRPAGPIARTRRSDGGSAARQASQWHKTEEGRAA